MSNPIILSDVRIFAVRSDLFKGYVDITFRATFSLELMKRRGQLLQLEERPLTLTITPPPSLLDEIELSNSQTGHSVTLDHPLDP